MFSGRITPAQEIDIRKSQDKAESGSALCKISKFIKQNIDIVTFDNVTTSLLSVVNSSCYHLLFNELTGLVSDAFYFRYHVL